MGLEEAFVMTAGLWLLLVMTRSTRRFLEGFRVGVAGLVSRLSFAVVSPEKIKNIVSTKVARICKFELRNLCDVYR